MSAVPQPGPPRDVVAKWRSIPGADFLLMDAPRPEVCGVHAHDKLRLSFLLKGQVTEVDDRRRTDDCGPFSLHTTPAGMPHAHLIRTERVTSLCFDLDPQLLHNLGDATARLREPITVKRGVAMTLAPKFQREVLATDTASDLVLQGLIYQLVGELSRQRQDRDPEPPSWLLKARDLLNDGWRTALSIEEIAKAVGVHPSHLNRVFRQHMNETPGEYLRRIRMERATRQVLVSDLPLKAIASAAGYADQAHFTREFRRCHGVTPHAMRRSGMGKPHADGL